MSTVSIKPPKTPVTEGSLGTAKNSVPNVCKMPGPPAPFVPSPLPNSAKSALSPDGFTKDVKVEGKAVAIQGASFTSIGDVASKGTGGGLVSANTHGPAKFIGPGAIDTLFEGKSVQLLGDPMTNNGAGSGSPPNASSIAVDQDDSSAGAEVDPCKKIIERFSLDVDTYEEHEDRKDVDKQSHHILQDAAIEDFCAKVDGLCVILADSKGGTEHGTITHEHQNKRMRNKKKGIGTQPASTFGELKKQARGDLVAGLEGKRKDKNGQPMTTEEAELAADCLVTKAEKQAQKKAKREDKKLNDSTTVKKPGGCLAGETLVRLASGELRRADQLILGDCLRTPKGPWVLTRIDPCVHAQVELVVDGSVLALATSHRLYNVQGCAVRAGALRAGDLVATAHGARPVTSARVLEPRRVYQLGVSGNAACLLGAAGVIAELPDTGPAVVREEPVLHWRAV